MLTDASRGTSHTGNGIRVIGDASAELDVEKPFLTQSNRKKAWSQV
jgi:hypothetical protein